MKANISRWIILLLALVCVVQAVSAFEVIKTEVKPDSDILEPGQEVNAHYVIAYKMASTRADERDDETFEFSTGLQNPSWDFKIRREGTPDIPFATKYGTYQTLLEFDLDYGGDVKLDVQVRGTVPTTSSSEVEIVKVEHLRNKYVEGEYHMNRKVVSTQQITGSLSAQQQRLKDLKADIDDKAGKGVDVAPAQAKYDAANQDLTHAASAGPSQAAGYIATATKAIDEAKALLDKAWAEKEVSNAAATLETLDGMITYFVENRSMGSDPQVVAIMTKRESAVQFYSQAKDNLNANNYPLARSKAIDGQNKANEALTDANALREKASSGSLDISSTPSGASIYIDGTYKGITPGVVSGLSAGSHQVRMLRSGYDDYTLITTVTAGKTTTVSAILTPISTSIPPPAYPTSGDVASVALAEGSLSVQQQRLTDLKADIDDKAGKGVDVSPAQAKYDAASQALANAASAGPSQAAEYIATATKVIDEGKSLLDRAWAEKEVSNAAATLETLNGLITYFVEDRSMGSDPQVVAIMTKRESAIQFYSQAKDNLNANNYPLARSKAIDGQNKANEALTDANALREKGDSGSNAGSNMLPYIGVMIVVVLSAGYFIYSRRSPGGRKGGDRTGGIRSPASPPDHGGGQASRRQKTVLPSREKPTDLSGVDVLGGKNERSLPYAVASERKSSGPVIKPEIAVTPSHTSIHADEWDKIGLTLANTGTAQAFDITLTFPNDIDTRLLRPVDLAAGESITLDVGIKPGAKGKVPLEIIVRYRDPTFRGNNPHFLN